MSDVIKRCIVQGKVQGVFFRASTQKVAVELGLLGWAKNCADGSVEVVAKGPSAAVLELEAWLRFGPPQARVDSLRSETLAECPQSLAGFQIL